MRTSPNDTRQFATNVLRWLARGSLRTHPGARARPLRAHECRPADRVQQADVAEEKARLRLRVEDPPVAWRQIVKRGKVHRELARADERARHAEHTREASRAARVARACGRAEAECRGDEAHAREKCPQSASRRPRTPAGIRETRPPKSAPASSGARTSASGRGRVPGRVVRSVPVVATDRSHEVR